MTASAFPDPRNACLLVPVLRLAGLPHCPICNAEAHELTFRPVVDSEGTRVLTNFAWRCPTGHVFATDMPAIPLPSWLRRNRLQVSPDLHERPWWADTAKLSRPRTGEMSRTASTGGSTRVRW
jgi:hypothetical protein